MRGHGGSFKVGGEGKEATRMIPISSLGMAMPPPATKARQGQVWGEDGEFNLGHGEFEAPGRTADGGIQRRTWPSCL